MVTRPVVAAPDSGSMVQKAWPLMVAAILAVVASAIAQEALWRQMHAMWSSLYGDYSHGYLTAALSVWLGWRYWRAAPPAALAPDWRGVVALSALVAMLAVMELVFISAGTRLLLVPPLFLACVWVLFGSAAARVLMLPALFFYYSIAPAWLLGDLLQWLTATVVGTGVAASGITAYIQNEFIHLPAGVFEIANACSGVSYFVAGLTLASFYALMYLRCWRSRWLLVGVAALVSLASNWLRVYILIMVGHFSQMQHWLVSDHHTFGWVVFLLLFAPVLLLARRLEDREVTAEDGAPAAGSPMAMISAPVAGFPLAGVLVAALLLSPALLVRGGSADITGASLRLPNLDAGLRRLDEFPSQWSPTTVHALESRLQVLDASYPVEIYRAVYPRQALERQLFASGNSVTGAGWRGESSTLRSIDLHPHALVVIEHEGAVFGSRRLVWSWYAVAGTPVASRQRARLRQVFGLFAGRRDAAVLALAVVCEQDCTAAREILHDYLRGPGAPLVSRPYHLELD